MSELSKAVLDWEFLVGYPLSEAQQILQEEAVSYELQFTAAPGKVSSAEDAFVISVQDGAFLAKTLVVVCASADWTVC
ncbi:MAG: hypothetical protein M0R49_14015 [Limnochordia bacterium]|nr:hypothetical protein [Limnochordia bacterium]